MLKSAYFRKVTYKCKSYLVMYISSRYEVFYIKRGDKNKNQCFPYSSIVYAAIDISQFK